MLGLWAGFVAKIVELRVWVGLESIFGGVGCLFILGDCQGIVGSLGWNAIILVFGGLHLPVYVHLEEVWLWGLRADGWA